MSIEMPKKRLIVVSNRLPMILVKGEGGKWSIASGSGGLVTALVPVLKNRGGLWVGWPGTIKEESRDIERIFQRATRKSGYTFAPVILTREEKNLFYYGFSNEVIWPLFHDLPSNCNFDPRYWHAYKEVNRKFAYTIAVNSRKNDYIWVHDYHLMNVAKELHKIGIKTPVGFFLHIPFPPLDIFLKLPWRLQILQALLEYDLIGFQTLRDRQNFVQCIRTLLKEAIVYGKGQVITCNIGERQVRIGSFPIGIDYNAFRKDAESQEVAERAWYIHEDIPNRKLILGVDRLDYTKGIPYRLEAFRNALIRYPELRRNVTFIQVVVPSRKDIPRYNELKVEIDRMVGDINGEFTQSGWVPIQYIFRNLERTELLAYYRTAEIALLTPLKDGMNLIAKEYCAANVDENGVLILSEFAGAAAQLHKGALLVNPFHIEDIADKIFLAYKMDREERQRRMRILRRSVREYNIFWWVDSFLRAAIAKDLGDFPLRPELVDYPMEGEKGQSNALPESHL